jgi:hypothetical protein
MTILSETYNGWTNYATWRVNLEIFDGLDLRDMEWHKLDKYDLAAVLKEYANEIVEMDAKEGLALDYARAFISDVDWYDIGRSMREIWADTYDVEETEG